ncbi:hypothetical protein LCGC14_2463920 [marine sediment metagenome]|uniref:Uncharacterized protein n=1 Tax=marine sediment metagenome TaxID=412755 RepID=A0A0F9BCE2_9ZZZZ
MGAVGLLLALPPEVCVHRWRIAYPDGPISKAHCQKCGQQRDYDTAYDGTNYGNRIQKFPKIALRPAEDWDG